MATATPTSPASAPVSSARTGCASWIVGGAVMVGLIALIWFGARLSTRLPGIGLKGDTPLVTVPAGGAGLASTPALSNPASPKPSPTPAIVPINGSVDGLVTVPDLVGQTEDEAIATLDQVDLVLDVGDTVTSDTVPSGHIASQDPAPGEQVVPGTSVLIHLSAGPATIDLAKLNLIGSSPDAAEETLTSLGVSVAFGETGPTDVPEGRVVALDPPDRVRPGETVTLLISMGNKVQIPRDIQGGPLQAAITTLEQLGFTVANTYAVPRSVLTSAGIDPEQAGIEDGDVVGIQDNGADFGAWLPPGTSVSLVYYDASLEG